MSIEGGDSGAWVVDNASGQVCGHVLAYSSKSGVAYIAPMEVLLDDMAKTLGAKISLPSPQENCLDILKEKRESCLKFGEPLNNNTARSPEHPTSPPLYTRELSELNLDEMLESKSSAKPPKLVCAKKSTSYQLEKGVIAGKAIGQSANSVQA